MPIGGDLMFAGYSQALVGSNDIYVPKESVLLDGYCVPNAASLPYGVWTTKDGVQVIYNRDYKPIFERGVDGVVSHAKDNWVPNIETDTHLYDDSFLPGHNEETMRKCEELFADWGITDEMRFEAWSFVSKNAPASYRVAADKIADKKVTVVGRFGLITYDETAGKYRAELNVGRSRIHLGNFATQEEAVEAQETAAAKANLMQPRLI
jgi:hypothetical protein